MSINLKNNNNMKFKVKPKPNFCDKKTVIKFAYFPTRIDNTVIWLEKYECTYRYSKDSFWDYYYWEVIDEKLLNH
jgi:hypothetical protein